MNFKLGVCVPTRDVWKPDFGQSLAMAGMAFWPMLPQGYEGAITLYNKTQCSIVHNGRNNLVIDALNDGCTHILFLDDDMKFPMETISRLFLHDKDIVGCNCTTKEMPARPTAITLDGEAMFTRASSTGLEKCKSTGGAVLMIKAEVFLKMKMPWFDFEWTDEAKYFDPQKDDNRLEFLGEDRYFCHKARDLGYDIWIDHDLSKKVSHVGDWRYSHIFVDGYKDSELTEEDFKEVGT